MTGDPLAAYEESLRLAQEVDDRAVQAEVLNGIGECLLELDRVDEAVTALTTAQEAGIERGSDYSLIYTYAFLSMAYTRRGQCAEALEVGRRSLASALESDSWQSEQNAHLRLAEPCWPRAIRSRRGRISRGRSSSLSTTGRSPSSPARPMAWPGPARRPEWVGS
ncbi:tetratricopeptide repeat protein [Kribbella capetownensis]|uniref:tetratricopeptide repeat protein n=1 Tax=Kribbella capetownensis TaxID=1572659 RepID=UPI0013F3C219|nr:tetratricopeptide repeat protein [Kribbella capetownensis]